MGMSASQARLLSLQARQSNLEYQGQQINQARSILSQQATALYNSLLSMTVPTPPSTTDFQTIQYKGTDGATKFTLGTITPESGGTYDVEIKYERNGNALKGGSYMDVNSYDIKETISGFSLTEMGYKTPQQRTYVGSSATNDEIQSNELDKYGDNTPIMHSVTEAQSGVNEYYYQNSKGGFEKTNDYNTAKQNGGGVVFVSTTIGQIKSANPDYNWNDTKNLDYAYNSSDTSSYYEGGISKDEFTNGVFYDANGKRLSLSDLTELGRDLYGNPIYSLPGGAIKESAYGGSASVPNPDYDPNEAQKGTTVGGNVVQPFSEETLGTTYESALQAIANSYPEFKGEDGKPDPTEIANTFSVIFKTNSAGERIPYFVKTADYQQKAQMTNYNGQNQIEVFSLEPNGSYNEAVQTKGCKLTFDTSGRISSIDIPILDENGEFTGKYNTIALEAETVTDEAAYKDAYAKYEYETYLYDQKNKEINAKTEIIQQEDKNLELKLQRLDNERTQITTEIEAVEKVINDNIEASYKTFSG